MVTVEEHIEFPSHGTTCRGLFVRPTAAGRAPLVVLVHGLGGIYEMRLDAYARRFAAAGYAALTFDYRSFGRSDGLPRHVLVRERQQADIEAAIAFGKTLPGVDASRVVLWGTSLGGGHVIDVSSRRSDLAASIVQAPFTDGHASSRETSLASKIGIGLFWIANVVARILGRQPVLVSLAGPPGWPALMSKPDVTDGVFRLLPDGSRLSARLSRQHRRRGTPLPSQVTLSDDPEQYDSAHFVGSIVLPSGTVLINGVSANFGLDIVFWRPGRSLERVRHPILVCACDGDSVAPPGPTIEYARRSKTSELKVYPYGHFDIYVGDAFEVVIQDQLAFLSRVVPTTAPVMTSLAGSGTSYADAAACSPGSPRLWQRSGERRLPG